MAIKFFTDIDATGELEGNSLDIDGNGDIAGNLLISAGTLSITGDGANATVMTESNDGDFQIDIASELNIDVDAGNIILSDGGSEFGRLVNSSQDFVIHNNTSDKDIIFKGNDGGSQITALTLDMGSAGNATFNAAVVAGTTLATGAFVLPNSIGSSGQVLQVPSSGTTLEWSSCCSGGGALDIDGLSDIGAALVDADIFAVDDGANGTNRKATMSRLATYINGKVPDASDADKGILKISSSQNSVVTQTVTTTSNRQYAIQTDSNGVGSVNVPWTDTNTTTTADVKTALGAAMGSNALQIGDGSTTTTFPGAITATGNINANGNIVGDDGTNITNINSIDCDSIRADGDSTTGITFAASDVNIIDGNENSMIRVQDDEVDINGAATMKTRKFAKTSNTDGDYNGDVVFFGGTTSMTTGAIYHFKSDGTWELADADSAANCDGMLGVALGAASNTNGVLLRGFVTIDHDPGAVGDVLFLSTTAGDCSATAPAGNGDIIRVIGYLIDASNGQIYFNPDGTYVEVSA